MGGHHHHHHHHHPSEASQPGDARYKATQRVTIVGAVVNLVLAVGTELAYTDRWRSTLGAKAPIVRVDIDLEMLAQCTGDDLAIRADAELFLRALNIELGRDKAASQWDAQTLAKTRGRWSADVALKHPEIVRICTALKAALSPKTRIYSDMTQFAYAAKEIWDMDIAGLWHHPVGFGTLGFALPAAIGGAVSGGNTLAIAGDYGLQYTLQELGTASEQMAKADERMKGKDPSGSREAARSAADAGFTLNNQIIYNNLIC